MGLGAEQFTWADEFTFLIFISFFSFPSEDGEMKLKIFKKRFNLLIFERGISTKPVSCIVVYRKESMHCRACTQKISWRRSMLGGQERARTVDLHRAGDVRTDCYGPSWKRRQHKFHVTHTQREKILSYFSSDFSLNELVNGFFSPSFFFFAFDRWKGNVKIGETRRGRLISSCNIRRSRKGEGRTGEAAAGVAQQTQG